MIKTSEVLWQDTQHQILFKLIEDLKQEPFEPQIIEQLQLYTIHHFSLEEAYMKALNYPGAEAHIRAHRRFEDELQQMVDNPEQLNAGIREHLSLFLHEWLKRHVLGIDKEFEQFLLASPSK